MHLWPDSSQPTDELDPEQAVEVTMRMAELPAGPTQRQVVYICTIYTSAGSLPLVAFYLFFYPFLLSGADSSNFP